MGSVKNPYVVGVHLVTRQADVAKYRGNGSGLYGCISLPKGFVSSLPSGRMGLKVKVHNLLRVKSKILAVSPVMDSFELPDSVVLKDLKAFSEFLKMR